MIEKKNIAELKMMSMIEQLNIGSFLLIEIIFNKFKI